MSKIKKILIDATCVEYGNCGYSTYSLSIIKELLDIRFQQFEYHFLIQQKIYAAHPLRGLLKGHKSFEVDIPVVGFKRLFYNASKLPFDLDDYDLYHCLHSNPLKLNWRKSLCTLHDLSPIFAPKYFDKFRFLKKAYFRLDYGLSLKKCDHIICVSHSTANDLKRLTGRNEEVSVIYEAGTNDIKNFSSEREEFFLCIGTRPHKNLEIVSQAAKHIIKNKLGNVKVKIAGRVSSHLKLLFSSLDEETQSKFELLGLVSDDQLDQLYSNARCLLFPSVYEGFGLPVLEAMHYNLPVICSNSSSLPEVGGDAVLYCDINDYIKLSELMMKVESEKIRSDLICKMKAQRSKFSWAKAAEETLKIYKKLLA